jgi:hypothetical protein
LAETLYKQAQQPQQGQSASSSSSSPNVKEGEVIDAEPVERNE